MAKNDNKSSNDLKHVQGSVDKPSMVLKPAPNPPKEK